MKVLLVFFCLLGTSAFASDGNRLITICDVADKTEWTLDEFHKLSACENYIDGVLDADAAWRGLMSGDKNHIHDKSRICIPDEGIQREQAARIVLKYLKEHPERLHWQGAMLVLNAVHEAFPCAVTK